MFTAHVRSWMPTQCSALLCVRVITATPLIRAASQLQTPASWRPAARPRVSALPRQSCSLFIRTDRCDPALPLISPLSSKWKGNPGVSQADWQQRQRWKDETSRWRRRRVWACVCVCVCWRGGRAASGNKAQPALTVSGGRKGEFFLAFCSATGFPVGSIVGGVGCRVCMGVGVCVGEGWAVWTQRELDLRLSVVEPHWRCWVEMRSWGTRSFSSTQDSEPQLCWMLIR